MKETTNYNAKTTRSNRPAPLRQPVTQNVEPEDGIGPCFAVAIGCALVALAGMVVQRIVPAAIPLEGLWGVAAIYLLLSGIDQIRGGTLESGNTNVRRELPISQL